ncbi:hypothetical protein KFL_006000040 [Klebsormidium nitens]|uniref:Uncharacterized protein n=1 Tax=Klebsormidium nitens TaxID=105231 RepID=A0A1Y1IGV9_KLENI|nr:hypothetical protein KFL_006000040 [Klebsormidium nitens]|eukprot:GAQ90100.1 hypothetical protein KFL_006000040 [Klebsormidium nitens]
MSGTHGSSLGASPIATLSSPVCKGQSRSTILQTTNIRDHNLFCSSQRESRKSTVRSQPSRRRAPLRRWHPPSQQSRKVSAAQESLTAGQALSRSVCSLGFALSVHLSSTSTALASDPSFLGDVDDIRHGLEAFDWAGWADWHESPLATGVVNIWTQWTAALASTAQPFELRTGESSSSLLFYLSVVLLLWGLTAQPKQ